MKKCDCSLAKSSDDLKEMERTGRDSCGNPADFNVTLTREFSEPEPEPLDECLWCSDCVVAGLNMIEKMEKIKGGA